MTAVRNALAAGVMVWYSRELTDKNTHVFKKHINVFFLKKHINVFFLKNLNKNKRTVCTI